MKRRRGIHRHAEEDGALWPRHLAWRKAFLWGIVIPLSLITGLALFLGSDFGTHFVAFMFLLVLARTILAIYHEHQSRPPEQHFWSDGHGSKRVVRHRRTRKVMLRSTLRSLARVDLRETDLDGADFRDIDLPRADFRSASLRGADLRGCFLNAADFTGADLSHALLIGASIHRTSFQGANLRGVHFVGRGPSVLMWSGIFPETDLSYAHLEGAIYDATTRWPLGFRPADHGLILAEAECTLPIPAEKEVLQPESLPLPAVGAEPIRMSSTTRSSTPAQELGVPSSTVPDDPTHSLQLHGKG